MGWAGVRTSGFSRRNNALTVTYYDQLSWLNKQVKTLLRTQGNYGWDVVVSTKAGPASWQGLCSHRVY